jgi:hypothetical protein
MAQLTLGKIGRVAAECVKHPGRPSFLLESEGRYICPKGNEPRLAAVGPIADTAVSASARIDPRFKLVFLTAAAGTCLFTLICVALHLATTGEPPPARKELIEGMLTMAKIGFGAIVGLLGGKVL